MVKLYDEISKAISFLSEKDMGNRYYDRCDDTSVYNILSILNSVSYWCLSLQDKRVFQQLVTEYTNSCGKEEIEVLKTDESKLIEYYKNNQACSPLEKYEMVNNNYKITYRPIITVKDS